jgi:hypothetical protein
MGGQGYSTRLTAVGAGERGPRGVGAAVPPLPRPLRGRGTRLLPGRPADPAQLRQINAVAVVILVIAAALPITALPLWPIPRARRVLLAACWAVAVGCCTHALINSIQRVLSRAGLLRIEYPPAVWAWIDGRAADLQDLFFTSPGSWWRGSGSRCLDGSSWAPVAVGDGGSAPRSPRSRC